MAKSPNSIAGRSLAAAKRGVAAFLRHEPIITLISRRDVTQAGIAVLDPRAASPDHDTSAADLTVLRRSLDEAQRRGLLAFDPLRLAPVSLAEIRLCDVLAAVLDPQGIHGFGTAVLARLLSRVRATSRHTREQLDRIRRLALADPRYSVTREYNVGAGRPDIVVIGHKFLISLEVKRRGGGETFVNGAYQTERYDRAWPKQARELGIPSENVLAAYLTSKGQRARSPKHIAVSSDLVADILEELLAERPNVDRKAFEAFITIYRRS